MDIFDIRMGNIRQVMSVLRFSAGTTRKDIAQLTNLSFSTVGKICTILESMGVIEDFSMPSYRVGRTPKLVRIKQSGWLSICLNIQKRDQMDLAILSINNRVLLFEQYDASACATMEELILFAHRKFEEKRQTLPWMKEANFIGVGVSVSGVFDKESRRIVNSAIPAMENAPIADAVRRIFQLPCYADNEANLCAIAMSQKETDVQNLIYLHLSEGAGVGVVCEGSLLRGNRGYAAEIAHMPLGKPERKCPSCGNFGCIEPDLCTQGLVTDSGIRACGNTYTEQWNQIAGIILTQETENITRFIRQKGELIGLTLSILVNLFDPQEILIGGEISAIFPKLKPVMEALLRQRCAVFSRAQVPILCDPDSAETIILGLNQMMFELWDPLAGVE